MEYNEVLALISSVDARINEINKSTTDPLRSKLLPDLQKEWQILEEELTKRESALKKELARQEVLEDLASSFKRKVGVLTGVITIPYSTQQSFISNFVIAIMILKLI
jgi:hypothetical protein